MSDRHKVAAQRRGTERCAATMARLEQTFASIVEDMEANKGVYPMNGGAVSIAEIARRAGINEATFYKKVLDKDGVAQKSPLKVRAELWLSALKNTQAIGRARVRKTHQERKEAWKEKYSALQNRHVLTELQLQQARSEYQKLKHAYDLLLGQLRSSNQLKVASLRGPELADVAPLISNAS